MNIQLRTPSHNGGQQVAVRPVADSRAGSGETATDWRYSALALLGLALALQIASAYLPTYVAPSWLEIIESIPDIRARDIWSTLARVVTALLFSFLWGSLIALAAHKVRTIERFGLPIIRFLMAVPAVAWVIITILWFADIETRILFVLSIVCIPVFVLDLLDAMRNIPKGVREMVMGFRPTNRQYYFKLIFPAILPEMFTSWKINISLAVRVVTIAELVGAVSGIGFVFTRGRNLFDMPLVFAATLILTIQLFALQGIVLWLEKRTLAWRG